MARRARLARRPRPRQPRPQPVVAGLGVAVLEPPAGELDALGEADQPRAGARDRRPAELRERRAADDLDGDAAARRAGDRRLDGGARRVLARVRQPLLHDPVDGPAGRRRQRSRRRRAARTRPRCPRRATRRRARRRRAASAAGAGPRARGLGGAQHVDDLAQVLERLVGARAHDAGGARDLLRRRVGVDLQRARVQAQQREAVGQHVVHLAGDAGALLRARLAARAGRARPRPGGCARAARA